MHKFLQDIYDGVHEAISTAIELGYKCAYYDYDSKCGFISVCTDNRNDVRVVVCHESGEEKKHPNIESAVAECVPSWYDVEKEMEEELDDYQKNGFNDEQDFIKWKYL